MSRGFSDLGDEINHSKEVGKMSLRLRLGQRVKEARQRLGMSQQALARAVGVSQATISDIERGRSWPEEKTMIGLAKVLGIELTDISAEGDGRVAERPVRYRPRNSAIRAELAGWLFRDALEEYVAEGGEEEARKLLRRVLGDILAPA